MDSLSHANHGDTALGTLVALSATQRMRATTEPQITVQSRQQRARFDRATLWRFHNSVYLGCVIGILTGCGFGHAALSWPKRAWQRASLRRKDWGSISIASPDSRHNAEAAHETRDFVTGRSLAN